MTPGAPHLCSWPGCPNIVDPGPGRCPVHRRKRQGSGVSYPSGWSSRVRPAYLRSLPVLACELCGATGVPLDVHHLNGNIHDNRFENLQALCRSDHNRLTQAAQKLKRAGGYR